MKQNLVAMLADLFNVLEVHPVKSVKCPGSGEYTRELLSNLNNPVRDPRPGSCMLDSMGVCGHNIKNAY